MKKAIVMFMGCLTVAHLAPASPDIEVEVRFIEVCQTTSGAAPSLSWQLDTSWTDPASGMLDSKDMTRLFSVLERTGRAALLSAPKVRAKSGTNATVKVVTEYMFPTEFEIRRITETNKTDVSCGVAIVPSDYYHS